MRQWAHSVSFSKWHEMKHRSEFRRRLFFSCFFLLAGVALIACASILALRFFHVEGLVAGAMGIAALLSISAVAAALWSGRIARQSRELVESIRSVSTQNTLQQVEQLQHSVYSDVSVAIHDALKMLNNAYFQKQTEARQQYSTQVEFMGMIAKAVDERTSYLRGHSERVASYATLIASELHIQPDLLERIRLAALLHDIGTISIEDSIVMKETPLTPEEFEIVKAHTVRGAAILRPIEALHDLIPGVELHHESLDGFGYPYGLKGDDIPIMARIISVADSFDAMTSMRPYQAAMEPDYVLEVMNRLGGTRYDPHVVQALTALVERGTIVVQNARPPVSFRTQKRTAIAVL